MTPSGASFFFCRRDGNSARFPLISPAGRNKISGVRPTARTKNMGDENMKHGFCCLLLALMCVLSVCALADGVLKLPAGLKVIEEETFYNTDDLVEVVLPEGLERIEGLAFYGSGVEKINLPSTITYIAEDAFDETKYIDVTATGGYPRDWAVEHGYIAQWGGAPSPEEDFRVNGSSIAEYLGDDANVVIPETINGTKITTINWMKGSYTSVEIPDGVQTLERAFSHCRNLKLIRIPPSVTDMDYYEFAEVTYGMWDTSYPVIYGIPGSYAERYAETHGYRFVIDEEMLAQYPSVSSYKINGKTGDMNVKVGDTLTFSGVVRSDATTLASVELAVYSSSDHQLLGVLARKESIGKNSFDLSTLGSFTVGKMYNGFAMEADGRYDIELHVENRGGKTFIEKVTNQISVIDVNKDKRYRALLIGQDYIGNTAGISTLNSCANDVVGMQRMLDDMPGTFYEVTKKSNLTKSEMLKEINSAFADVDENDVSLFYYSGHGVTTWDTAGALLGYDRETLTAAGLKKKLDSIPGKKIVILDSCYSGAHIGKGTAAQRSAAEAFNKSVISVFASDDTSKNLAQSGYYVLTSSHSSELSLTSQPYSVFTSGILKGSGLSLYGVGSDGTLPADTSGDKKISLSECYSYAYEYALDDQHAQVYPENSGFILWAK